MTRTSFSEQIGIDVPLICGAMYPCTNVELVAAVSEAGGIGIVQPLSLIYVHGEDLRAGLRRIRSLTDKPYGFNALVEKSVQRYEDRMRAWVDIAIEEGTSLFITALGNPNWVVERAHSAGIPVYHDVTERKWAQKALDHGVDGLICVNNRAGGHAGTLTPAELIDELSDIGLPLICAGGIGDGPQFAEALELGYAGCQLGTRFIASAECTAHADYKQAIIDANESDIVLSRKITGVPVSVIKTPFIEKMGTQPGPFARWMLRGNRRKHWMRTIYGLQSIWRLKRASLQGRGYKDLFQAGKSVQAIDQVEPAGEIVRRFADALTKSSC